MSIQIFWQFFNRVGGVLLLICLSSSCILNINHSADICYADIFYHSVGCLGSSVLFYLTRWIMYAVFPFIVSWNWKSLHHVYFKHLNLSYASINIYTHTLTHKLLVLAFPLNLGPLSWRCHETEECWRLRAHGCLGPSNLCCQLAVLRDFYMLYHHLIASNFILPSLPFCLLNRKALNFMQSSWRN